MDPTAIFFFARARDRLPMRLSFARVKSPPVLAFSLQVAPPVLPASHRSLQVPPQRLVSDSLQVPPRCQPDGCDLPRFSDPLLALLVHYRSALIDCRCTGSSILKFMWRAGAYDGVPGDYDRLRAAARGGPEGFCRDRWTIYSAKKVRVAWRTARRARSAFCQGVHGLAYMPSLFSHLPNCPKCHWIPFFWFLTNYKNAKSKCKIVEDAIL